MRAADYILETTTLLLWVMLFIFVPLQVVNQSVTPYNTLQKIINNMLSEFTHQYHNIC